jgi:hypothetical protein
MRGSRMPLKIISRSLQGENEALREQLAAERDRPMKTLAAFSDLAERLNALAAERAAPWWRRLLR